MTAVKSSKKLISVLLALAMLFSSVICVPAIQAYAASLSKPTVTLTNTAPTTIKVNLLQQHQADLRQNLLF